MRMYFGSETLFQALLKTVYYRAYSYIGKYNSEFLIDTRSKFLLFTKFHPSEVMFYSRVFSVNKFIIQTATRGHSGKANLFHLFTAAIKYYS